MEELLDLVQSPRRDSKSKGVFLATISFSDTSIVFSPTESEVLHVLNSNVIEGMIQLVQAMPRLLYIRTLSNYFEGKMTGLNPVQIVRATPLFIDLRAKIDAVVVQVRSAPLPIAFSPLSLKGAGSLSRALGSWIRSAGMAAAAGARCAPSCARTTLVQFLHQGLGCQLGPASNGLSPACHFRAF